MEGKYELLEIVGSGKFSIVHKARERGTGQIVAVKIIRYKKVKNGVPCSVIREVSILKELDHENIVRLQDVLATEKEISLVFEYLDCNLLSFIISEPEIARDPRVIKKFLYQILSGAAFCHSQNILHRDLKPQNILVDSQNQVVKLADFGISREVGVPRKTYTSKVATLQYMAPEILFTYPQYSSSMDIWAVGCIFAEMVKGRQIFKGHRLVEQIEKIFRTWQKKSRGLNQKELIFFMNCSVSIQARELQIMMLLSIPISAIFRTCIDVMITLPSSSCSLLIFK